ncbi:MAG: hypothetical protein E6G56_07290 [Actinobacteria bacterium]|nr:MAG: hypothetical protein E6G56_07290 [Actinomycetota bacterium]
MRWSWPRSRGARITKIRTTLVGLLAPLTAALAIAAVGLALLAAGPASAQPAGGPTGSSKGYPVEDEHGNVFYVKAGTRFGLFVCGADGEWHFGWLVNARVVPSGGAPTGPPHHGVLKTKARRVHRG